MTRLLLLILALLAPAAQAKRPNLLLITVDDMNRDSVGAYGCPIENITPNLDRLAAQGIRFDRGFVNVAICMPCRAVLMTGRYPQTNGALGFDRISPEVPSLPEALKTAGYYNGLIGKEIHVVPSRHHAFHRIRRERDLGFGRDPEKYAEAMKTMLAEAGDRPFFIMANTHDPHRPFAGGADEKYKPRPEIPRVITEEEAVIPGFLPDIPPVRKELAQYFSSVHRADLIVGRILAELDAAGHAEDTLVIFLSDHGMPLPFAKTNCYPASNLTPWIIRWPGRIKPGSIDATHFVSTIDLAPTFLDAAGLPNLEGADGFSILPLLDGERQPARNHVFTFHQRPYSRKNLPMRALNDGEFLYIWNGWSDGKTQFRNESMTGLTFAAMANSDDPKIRARADFYIHRTPQELYDLRNDPDCLHNLLAEPGGKWNPRASAMTKRLWHWMKNVDDPELKLFEQQVDLALD